MDKKVIIIIVIVVLALALGVGAWLLFKPEKGPVTSFYIPGEHFVTNVKDSDYLFKTTVVLELSRDDVDDFLDENNYIIRDAIIFILREKTIDELRDSNIKEKLQKEIINELEKRLEIDYINTIYFNDYIFQ